jgi:uncharacterized protein Yka (UPF0111/DUF47 family)
MPESPVPWARRFRVRLERLVRPEAGREESGLAQHLETLERRVEHLEAMLEGLQDSIHRESVRQAKRIEQLQAQADPAAIRRALSQDARERGL